MDDARTDLYFVAHILRGKECSVRFILQRGAYSKFRPSTSTYHSATNDTVVDGFVLFSVIQECIETA
jgi:hypothetical protein